MVYDWGIGRARPNYDDVLIDFSYFIGACPWDLIKENPMKPAIIEIVDLVNGIDLIELIN